MQMNRLVSLNRTADRWVFHPTRQTLILTLFLNGILALPCAGQSAAQQFQQSMQNTWSQNARDSMSANPADYGSVYDAMRLRALNAERQKKLVADTDKLLKLAAELKAEMSSANSGSFTPDQLRKLGEIEKLAHSVKEKMRTTVWIGPVSSPYSAVYR
jgi:hypothetical protein